MSLQNRECFVSFRANRKVYGIARAFAAICVFFAAQHAAASSADDIPVRNIASARLIAEEAAFELHRGNMLGAAILTAGSDDPLLTPLRSLAHVKLGRAVEPGISYADYGPASEALREMFLVNDMAALKASTNGVKNPVAAYYGALAAYGEGDFKTVSNLIQSVDASSPLYPYALILMAQIQIKNNYPGGALSIINVVISRAPDLHDEATDAARMYKGYLLYELGRYAEAEEAFLSISYGPLKNEALANAAHSALRASKCKDALAHIGRIEAPNPLGAFGQELLLAKAHCLKETGKTTEAIGLVTETMKILNALTDGYDKTYASKTLPEETEELLSTTRMAAGDALFKPAGIDGKAIAESIRIEAATKDSEKLKKAEFYYTAADETERTFKKKITELDYAIHAISARKASLESWFEGNRSGATSARARLQYLKDAAYEDKWHGPTLRDHGLGEAVTAEIEKKWSFALSRPLSASEKLLIHLVLLDGAEGETYLDNIQYSQLLYLMTVPLPPGQKTPIADRIAADLGTMANSGPLPKELYIPTVEEWITKKLAKDALEIKKLKDLKALAEKDLADAFTVKKAAVSMAREILLRRAALLRFEIRSINEKARGVLTSISGKREADK
ncbi:MAG: hypothetical protein OEV59_01750 [Deltaproteobacteria bacterium]|nr:hypothetical protein [Deltaproteobacteria bacterium]